VLSDKLCRLPIEKMSLAFPIKISLAQVVVVVFGATCAAVGPVLKQMRLVHAAGEERIALQAQDFASASVESRMWLPNMPENLPRMISARWPHFDRICRWRVSVEPLCFQDSSLTGRRHREAFVLP
jgi:hypothetical protein